MTKRPQPSYSRSKYTADRGLAGAFDGETITRRRFVSGTATAAGAIAAAAFTLPALGFAIAPVFEQTNAPWQKVGPLSQFTDSDYVPEVITIEPDLGQAGLSTAFIRKHNPAIDGPVKDQYDRVIAISSRCVHVGCPVRMCRPPAASCAPATAGYTTSAGSGRAGRRHGRSTGSTR